MLKCFVIPFLALNTMVGLAQTNSNSKRHITGNVIGKPIGADTIYFSNGSINAKYYENTIISSPLEANKFNLRDDFSYPVMYRVHFASDKNKVLWRRGFYFIDAATTAINTNYVSDNCSTVNGDAATEYQNKFVPFMTKGMVYDCKSYYLDELYINNAKKADSLLLSYVMENPASYVALWGLIQRFSTFGESALRGQVLAHFSNEVKSERLWKTLNADFNNSKIKENEPFPAINLKNYDLSATKFTVPKAKYTLIDYWFARCRPCLDTIPALKKLYADYKAKGFDIVGISVDETINVPIWQQRVKEHGLDWTQYLEENNFRVNELGIASFPTFILLDKEGKVIWKDFDLHDLDKFLKENI